MRRVAFFRGANQVDRLHLFSGMCESSNAVQTVTMSCFRDAALERALASLAVLLPIMEVAIMAITVRPDFLFASPSWLSGAARTLDLAGVFDEYNDSPDEDIADARAMFCDWRIVGDTILDALTRFRRDSSQAPEP